MDEDGVLLNSYEFRWNWIEMMRVTLKEIAKRLNLNIETLERWIRQGRIPVRKSGTFAVFNEIELKRWAQTQQIHFSALDKEPSETKEDEQQVLALLTAMKKGGCYDLVSGKTREDVLLSTVNLVPGLEQDAVQELYEQLIERERLTSTGIGKGVAVPHPRNPLSKGLDEPMILTCFLENQVEFYAIDDQPVFVLFLMLSPKIEQHLFLLSRLSYCLRDSSFINFLKESPAPELLFEKIKTIEKTIEKKGF